MKRMINANSQSNENKVKLEVMFDPYERYGSSAGLKIAKVSGNDLLEALKKMTDRMGLYLDSEVIEEEEMTADEVIQSISESNGDGCDFIYYIKDLNSGQFLLHEGVNPEDFYEDWD